MPRCIWENGRATLENVPSFWGLIQGFWFTEFWEEFFFRLFLVEVRCYGPLYFLPWDRVSSCLQISERSARSIFCFRFRWSPRLCGFHFWVLVRAILRIYRFQIPIRFLCLGFLYFL